MSLLPNYELVVWTVHLKICGLLSENWHARNLAELKVSGLKIGGMILNTIGAYLEAIKIFVQIR
jgi:hypothetical protein